MIFEDGEKREEAFLTHHPKTIMNGDFAKQLGIEMTAQGDAKVSVPFQETDMVGFCSRRWFWANKINKLGVVCWNYYGCGSWCPNPS